MFLIANTKCGLVQSALFFIPLPSSTSGITYLQVEHHSVSMSNYFSQWTNLRFVNRHGQYIHHSELFPCDNAALDGNKKNDDVTTASENSKDAAQATPDDGVKVKYTIFYFNDSYDNSFNTKMAELYTKYRKEKSFEIIYISGEEKESDFNREFFQRGDASPPGKEVMPGGAGKLTPHGDYYAIPFANLREVGHPLAKLFDVRTFYPGIFVCKNINVTAKINSAQGKGDSHLAPRPLLTPLDWRIYNANERSKLQQKKQKQSPQEQPALQQLTDGKKVIENVYNMESVFLPVVSCKTGRYYVNIGDPELVYFPWDRNTPQQAHAGRLLCLLMIAMGIVVAIAVVGASSYKTVIEKKRYRARFSEF